MRRFVIIEINYKLPHTYKIYIFSRARVCIYFRWHLRVQLRPPSECWRSPAGGGPLAAASTDWERKPASASWKQNNRNQVACVYINSFSQSNQINTWVTKKRIAHRSGPEVQNFGRAWVRTAVKKYLARGEQPLLNGWRPAPVTTSRRRARKF